MQILNRICAIRQQEETQSYLRLLALAAARELDISYVLIGQPDPDNPSAILTRVAVANNAIVDNFSYELGGTPCHQVITGRRVCAHGDRAAELFPEDLLLDQMGVQSYIGAPIVDLDDNLKGLLVFLDTKSMSEIDKFSSIIEFLATRVALEIDRENDEHTRKRELARVQQAERLNALGQLASGHCSRL